MFRSKAFLISLTIFLMLQLFLYLFIFFSHQNVQFANGHYLFHSHHYLQDPRIVGEGFSFLRAIGAWDGQWYLRIADAGYPAKALFDSHPEPQYMGALTYAFFPFFPLIVSVVDLLFQNVELSAFIINNVLLVACFFSLYFVVTKLFSKEVAVRTIFLFLLFPMTIFYRSYYTEPLFLLMLIWWNYFLIKKQWFYATLLVSLLFVTRPNGIVLGVIMAVVFFYHVFKAKMPAWKAIVYLGLSSLPFLGWLYFNYVQTANPLYWHYVQSVWFRSPSVWHTIKLHMQQIVSFFELPLHAAHTSKIDVLFLVVSLFFIIKSRKFFAKYPVLWWFSLLFWLVPFLTKDLQSYSRYQMLSFPLFIYIAAHVNGISFYLIAAFFYVIMLLTFLYFINWHWVG